MDEVYMVREFFVPTGKGRSIRISSDMQINQSLLPASDSVLIMKAAEVLGVNDAGQRPKEGTALFYPAAGRDLITPILLGIQFCTDFYFYECSGGPFSSGKAIEKTLEKIFDNVESELDSACKHVYKFTYEGQRCRVLWVRGKNTDFLELDVNLAMYFHRGDSYGEGGSGECWDSKLFNLLKSKARSGLLRVITQGEPGGLGEGLINTLRIIQVNSESTMHRDGKYYVGVCSASTEQSAVI